jgi:hypothetical protein
MDEEIRRLSDWDISKDIGLPESFVSDETLAEIQRLRIAGENNRILDIITDLDHFRLVKRLKRENAALRAQIESLLTLEVNP